MPKEHKITQGLEISPDHEGEPPWHYGTTIWFKEEGKTALDPREAFAFVYDEESARLVAALPDLLQACKTVALGLESGLGLYGHIKPGEAKVRIKTLKAAIAKAGI